MDIFAAAGSLCFAVFALVCLVAIGRGVWNLVWSLWRDSSRQRSSDWQTDCAATLRQLDRLHSRGQLKDSVYAEVVKQVRAYQADMQAGRLPAAHVGSPALSSAASHQLPPAARPANPFEALRPRTQPSQPSPGASSTDRPPQIQPQKVPSTAPSGSAAAWPPLPTSTPRTGQEPLDAILVEPFEDRPPASRIPPPVTAPPVIAQPASLPAASAASRQPHPLDRDYATDTARPSIAHRAAAEVMQAFMAEKNIRWGELVSGLLIVGSAVGLVLSLQTALSDRIPYFSALIFMLITLSIYGAGMYTLRRWNLQATSQGVLIIALLLTPLNFTAGILLSKSVQRPATDPAYAAAIVLGVLACGWITFSAGRALIGAAWWKLTVAVLATAIGQVIVHRLAEPAPEVGRTALLLALPLCGYLAATLAQLLATGRRRRLTPQHAQPLFLVLGLASFALMPPLALYLARADELRAGMAALAPVFSLVGAIVLAAGLLVQGRSVSRRLVTLRVTGTSLAVAGAMLLLAALAVAWPRPDLLIVVGSVNFVALAALAAGGRLPVLHVPAAACLAAAILVGFHVAQGNVGSGTEVTSVELARWLIAGRSAVVLALLSVLSLAAAAAWARFSCAAEAWANLASAAGLGAASLAAAAWAGFGPGADRELATPVMAFFAIASLAAAVIVSRREADKWRASESLTWIAAGLWLAALLHATWWNELSAGWLEPRLWQPYRPITLALLTHALSLVLAALLLTGRQLRLPVYRRVQPLQSVVSPLLIAALATASLGAVLALRVLDPAIIAESIYLGCAAAVWLMAAVIYRHPVLLSVFQVLATIALTYATAAASDRWRPLQGMLAWQQLLQAVIVVLACWCLAWSLLRRLLRDKPAMQAVMRTAEPTVDEWLLGALLAVAAGLAFTAAWPGLVAELAGWRPEWALAAPALTWVALATLSVAVLMSLVERASLAGLIGLLVLGAAAVLLLASQAPEVTASALRWYSAAYALMVAVVVWMRAPLYERLRQHPLLQPWAFPEYAVLIVRETGLLLGATPIVAVSMIAAGRAVSRLPLGIVPADSFFGRLGPTLSFAVPLSVLLVVLLGHAIRERRADFALLGSIILQYMVSLAFVLQVRPDEAGFAAGLLQWNAVALAGYALLWLSLHKRIAPAGAEPAASKAGASASPGKQTTQTATGAEAARRWPDEQRAWPLGESRFGFARAQTLLGVQLGAAGLTLLALCAWAALAVFLTPERWTLNEAPLGGYLSYLAWLGTALAIGICGWSRRWPRAAILWPALLATGGWMLAALIAATVDPLDPLRHWTAYHVLTCGGLLLATALTAAAWRWPAVLTPAALSGGAVFLLAVRGAVADAHPWAPWWSIAASAAVALQATGLAIHKRSQWWAYASGIALATATTCYWLGPFLGRWPRDEAQASFELIVADAVALLIAATLWLGVEIWQQRRGAWGLDPYFPGPRYHALASLVVLTVLALLLPGTAAINSLGFAGRAPGVDLVAARAWIPLVLLGCVLAAALWDRRARYAIGGLYVWGLVFAALVLDQLRLAPHTLLSSAVAVVAAYVMLTSLAWRQGAWLASLGASWEVPDPVEGLKRTSLWLPPVNLLAGAGCALLALLIVSTFEDRQLRFAAAAAPAMLAIAAGALAQQKRQASMQFLALLMTGLACVYISWADLPPRWNDFDVLVRSFRLLMALSALTLLYAAIVPRLIANSGSWALAVRRAAKAFSGAAMISLVAVLTLEVLLYRAGGVRVDGVYVAAVAVVLVALAAGLIALALEVAPGPLALSEEGRAGYVYAAELVAALLFVHLYLCRPEWFGGVLRPYWPYIVMAIAFAGAGVGELFQRGGVRVLAEPLQRTAAFLPLLPVVGVWIVAAEGTDYSLLLFGVGLIYVLLSILRGSAASVFAAVVAGNGALWSLLHDSGYSPWQHPQFWLIPPAVSVLIAGQLNRERLTSQQLSALRYACVLVIYVSSTSEIFLRGVGDSLWPPMLLALLSVAGVLLGMVLQVRAFLYLGSTFVLLSVVSMVWHTQRAVGHVWPWFAFGIALGLAILCLFGLFEKKRPEMTRWIESLRSWEQ